MADINVKIGGDTSALDKKIGGLKKSFNKLGPAVAIGIAAGTAAITAMTAKIIELGDNIGKAAKRMGVSAESFQKLSFAAERAGSSANDVEKAFKRMSSVIVDAENGLTESKRALAALGLSFDDLKGKKPEEQFDIIAERLALVEDFSLKSATAQDVFGRAGTAIIPMLENYKQLGDELERVGGIMSNEAVEAAEKLKDDLTDLERTTTALAANSGFIAWLADISGGFNSILKSGNAVENMFRNIISSLADSKLAKLSGIGLVASGLEVAGLGVKEQEGTGAITPEMEAKEQARIDRQKKLKKEVAETISIQQAAKEREKTEAKLLEQVYKDIDKQEREAAKKKSDEMKEFNTDYLNAINEIDKAEKKSAKELEAMNAQRSLEGGTQETASVTDSLQRIGGSIGGTGNAAMNLDKKRNDLIGKLVKLYEKGDNGLSQGEVMI